MDLISVHAFVDEMEKIATKPKHHMPSRTKANVEGMMKKIRTWDSPHKAQALRFAEKATPGGLFELLHSMRRWYSGQTMAGSLIAKKEDLSKVMKLEAKSAVGVFRGFKVWKDDPLAKVQPGQKLDLEVLRNRGLSSWSLTEAPAHKFSGGGKGKVGLVVKLVDPAGAAPVLAPPEKTKPWFNELYGHIIGKSFRTKEQEYLLAGKSLKVEVVHVKK